MIERVNSFKEGIIRLGGTETDADYLERVGHALYAVGKPPSGTEVEVTLSLPLDKASSPEIVLLSEEEPTNIENSYIEDSQPRILSATEAAQQIKVSPTTISRAIQNGWLKGEKIGRQYFISEDALLAYQRNISSSLRKKPGPKSRSSLF